MNCRLVPLWAAALLLGCPQVLEDGFQLGSSSEQGPDTIVDDTEDGTSLDARVDAGVLAAVDPTLSHVVRSVPAAGARGVLPDAPIQLEFSAPMNRTSVEAAYASSDLPAAEVSFVWSEGDTVLQIAPRAALRSSAGSDPALVAAVPYALQIGSGARDQSGRPLAPAQLRFSVARAISQTLGAVRDRDLTGNWRADGVYGMADCERSDTTVCVGDGVVSGEYAYRGFMSFDLSLVPADAIEVASAQLGWTVAFVYGQPYTSLGALHIEHVRFAAIGDAAFSAPALPERQSINSIIYEGDTVAYPVLPALQAEWGVRQLLQFRFAYETATDKDGVADQLACDWSTAKLALTYWLP